MRRTEAFFKIGKMNSNIKDNFTIFFFTGYTVRHSQHLNADQNYLHMLDPNPDKMNIDPQSRYQYLLPEESWRIILSWSSLQK